MTIMWTFMYGYIYLTENLINGMCYIGQHKSNRNNNHYKGSGKYLTNAFKTYGKDNFVCTPIEYCDNLEELNRAEEYWIRKCDAVNSPFFYNLIPGGGVTFSVRDVSGSNNPMYGVDRSGENAPNINTVAVSNGETTRYVKLQELDDFLLKNKTFHLGGGNRAVTDARVKSSKATYWAKHDAGLNTTGYKWFKNLETFDVVYIKLSDTEKVNKYLSLGYIQGHLTKAEKALKSQRSE